MTALAATARPALRDGRFVARWFRNECPAFAFVGLVLWLAAWAGRAQELVLAPFKPSGIYVLGEKAGWNVTLPDGAPTPSGKHTYTIRKNNWGEPIKSGELDFASGRASIEVMLNEPAMLHLQVVPPAPQGNDFTNSASGPLNRRPGRGGIAAAAAIAPTKLQPVAPRPADFDAFWESKIKWLKSIPENPMLTVKESGKPDVEYAVIQMDHINDAHVYGQLAKPKKEGKFPGLVIFQWAGGPYPLQRQWVTDRAMEGWLTLNIEPHNVPPDQPQSYYGALPQELKSYQAIGRTDREKCYFLQMYLADYRALDYLTSRPDWDGKTLVVMGTSMGGQQSLCVAGLHPKITHVIAYVPAGCDSNGQLHGRAAGYPNWPSNDPKVMETALYFDAVNFAPHIKATCLVAMGFVDTIAPPVGIWTAFNQIPGPKEALPLVDAPHNNYATAAQQRPYFVRSSEWLATLVNGGEIKPNEHAAQP